MLRAVRTETGHGVSSLLLNTCGIEGRRLTDYIIVAEVGVKGTSEGKVGRVVGDGAVDRGVGRGNVLVR